MKTVEKMNNYENLDGLTNPINSESSTLGALYGLLHPGKMACLKHIILKAYLTESEFNKRVECYYEFIVEYGTITRLEIWYNPRGDHKYEEKYREEFKVNLPLEIIYKKNSIDSPASNLINVMVDFLDFMNQG